MFHGNGFSIKQQV